METLRTGCPLMQYPCPAAGVITSPRIASALAWKWCKHAENCHCRANWPAPSESLEPEEAKG